MNDEILPATTALGPVHLKVANLDRSITFYEDQLGLQTRTVHGETAFLGAGGPDLLQITAVPGARQIPGHSGLYHFALLLPSRAELGATLRHLLETGTALSGAADHLVSEALYLSDPDGNGIELYRDRPRSEWRVVNGRLQMDTLPLDFPALLAAAGPAAAQMPAQTVMGHMHLHVGDLSAAVNFYQQQIGFDLQLYYGTSAAFLSAGGYHHHLGLNTWAGVGAPPPPPGAAGLIGWTLLLPGEAALEAVRTRLSAAGTAVGESEGWLVVRDPAGNGLQIGLQS